MSNDNLNQLVEQLKSEVHQLPPEDEAARKRIEAIIENLDSSIASQGHASVKEGIQETIHELEARHPDATTVLNNILMTLANMDI